VRLYDHLFATPDPSNLPEGKTWKDFINPRSLEVLSDAKLEPSMAAPTPGETFQFERLGYFCTDADTKPGAPVFNRTVSLKDAWVKEQKKAK
jgi:glutaminyl-tRNA synthetase